jgi:hypothetical protein
MSIGGFGGGSLVRQGERVPRGAQRTRVRSAMGWIVVGVLLAAAVLITAPAAGAAVGNGDGVRVRAEESAGVGVRS